MSDEHEQYDHERTDAAVLPVALFAVGIALLSILVFVGMALAFGALSGRAEDKDNEVHPMVSNEPPPGPRLQANPGRERREYEERMAALTSEYRWVDPDGGVLRIPVERALDLIVNEGLPARAETPGAEADRSGGQR